jgi:uncharacterized Ntn-hydrolase superfamily protein
MSRSLLLCVAALAVPAAALVSDRPAPPSEKEEAYAATFSIVAYDPDRKEWGVAVASKYLAVGAVVPYAKAGAGAVATQAAVNVTLGTRGVELLGEGKSAKDALDALKKLDQSIESRQLGLVDAEGEAVTFTGKKCFRYAGGKTGKHVAVQGNILKGEAVVDDMLKAYEKHAKWPLAWRLQAALEAGEKAGGDKRGKQAAGLLVVREKGGPNGFGDRAVDLRVDDHASPVEELGRILAKRMRRPKAVAEQKD